MNAAERDAAITAELLRYDSARYVERVSRKMINADAMIVAGSATDEEETAVINAMIDATRMEGDRALVALRELMKNPPSEG